VPKTAPAFPFPTRNSAFPQVEDVIFVDLRQDFTSPETLATIRRMYARSCAEEARSLRLQYLTVEEELERAYRYVTPTEQNALTFSFKFADIIRGAANVYELLSKVLYARFYNSTDRLDIFNYLALDRFLALSGRRVVHLLAVGGFSSHPEVIQPFHSLTAWDQNSPVASTHVPGWWRAYNDIKHSIAGVEGKATQANATSAVAAQFLLVEATFGFGILNGGHVSVPAEDAPSMSEFGYLPRWSRLFSLGSPLSERGVTGTFGGSGVTGKFGV
jgi:hypothetical protein